MSVHTLPRAAGKPLCGCCYGSGSVLAIDGSRRPCSRCRADEFNRWAEARRQQPEVRDRRQPA